MSRYEHEVVNKEGIFTVACGYDEPLSEYFIQVWNNENEDEEGLVFAIGSHHTMKCHPDYPGIIYWSNGGILKLMKEWNCTEEHLNQVARDLPF